MPVVAFTRALERFLPVPAIEVDGSTLGEALAAVFDTRPALRGYILDEQGAMRRHVVVYINGDPARDRQRLRDTVAPRDEIYVFQALSGGQKEASMSDRIYVGTRKGLFDLRRTGAGWQIADIQFLGDPVTAVADFEGATLVGLDLGHFGAKLWKRDLTGAWKELPAPAFPPKPETAAEDPHPWTLDKIWGFEPGGVPGRIWAGSMPGGLFRSDDGGESWSLVESFWRMAERQKWGSVAGGGLPGLSTVSIDPRNPAEIRVGVSTGGVWASHDTGKTWHNINRGLYAEYMPPEQREEPIAQDVHQLARCRAHPDVIWCQHHNGVFRSEDSGATWRELTAVRPSKFGFAVAAHPRDRNTAWFVPAVKDEKRIPVDGKLVVTRTRNAGKSFDVLTSGLPQSHAYDLVYRHALAVDDTGERLAFGSTTGGLWISEDGGDTWAAPDMRLPPVNIVTFAG